MKRIIDKRTPVPIIEKSAQGPCWEGYEQQGMKTKKNKQVPNCIPKTPNK